MVVKTVDLIHELKTRSPIGQNLAFRLESVRTVAESILSRIPIAYEYFTPHDINHKARVLKYLNKIIPASFLKCLNEYEIFFLISAVYLHDIGMAPLFELYGTNLTEDDLDNIRKNHHIKTEEYIIRNPGKLCISDEPINLDGHATHIIGRICRGHRQEPLEDPDLYDSQFNHHDSIINIPLLSLLLRIADELDLTSERSPEILMNNIPPSQKESLQHWEELRVVAGLNVAIDEITDDYYLTGTAERCPSINIHTRLLNHQDKINKELDRLPLFLRRYDRKSKKSFPRDLRLKIVPHGYVNLPLKLRPSPNVLQLLVGEMVYGDSDAAIRELLKNSIDACKLLQENKIEEHSTYFPEIKVDVSTDKDKLTISDNGIGMDDYDLDFYFTSVRNSLYKSKGFLSANHTFNPLSELGIGFIASFMISDKIEVHTKKMAKPTS